MSENIAVCPPKVRPFRAAVARVRRLMYLFERQDAKKEQAERFGLWDMDDCECPICGRDTINGRCTNQACHEGDDIWLD
jgi:hypothetical protein